MKYFALLSLLVIVSVLALTSSKPSSARDSLARVDSQTPTPPKRSGRRPDTKVCSTCPEPTSQFIYAPTIGLPEATGSQIVLNSRSSKVMEVTPTFYTPNGSSVIGESFKMQPAEIRFMDIKKLIPARYRERRSWGGMSLSYTGHVLEMWAQLTLLGVGEAGSTDVTFSVNDGRGSDTQEAVWWMPQDGVSVIALGNSSDKQIHTSIVYSDGDSQEASIQPHGTEYVQRRARDVIGKQFRAGSSIAVKLITEGAAGSLRASGAVFSKDQSFSSGLRFYDTKNAVQPHLFATNLRLKNALPRMVLKNTGDVEVSAQPRFRPAVGEIGSVVELPLLKLQPQESVEVDLSQLVSAAAYRTDLDTVSVQVVNSGLPGSLIGVLYSLNPDTGVMYDVPLRDSGGTRNLTGSYPWRVDRDYTTVVTVSNVGDQPAKFHVDVRYPGGSYYLPPRELGVGETATFDMREMLAAQARDHNGNLLPQNLKSGQFHWSVASTSGNPKLVGRAEVVSISKHVNANQ